MKCIHCEEIECLCIEFTIGKSNWLLFGTYNPRKSISNHLFCLGKSIDNLVAKYENIIILGDLNSAIQEDKRGNFKNCIVLKTLSRTPLAIKKNPKNYGDLNPSAVTDNKKFWKVVKPLFSDKVTTRDNHPS